MSDQKYSFKDFTGHDLTANQDMSGITIEGSCFSHETPDSDVFPADMTGATFIDCNLDNCAIPPGNTVLRGTQKRFLVQNDLNDWIVDESNLPVKPMIDEFIFEKFGLPVPTPDQIPTDFIRTEVVVKADFEKEKDSDAFKSWFLEEPRIVATEVKKIQKQMSPEEYQAFLQSGSDYPFDSKPFAEKKSQEYTGFDPVTKKPIKTIVVYIELTGVASYITIEGKGRIKGGEGFRIHENKPVDLLARPE